MKTFPIEFMHQIEAALGSQSSAFFEALEEQAPVSYLANKAKFRDDLTDSAGPVPWCPDAYYLNERPEFIFDPAFHAGAYYVMEASSMMLWQGLDNLFKSRHNLRILDLCGAPGGKAMVTANFLGENSLLVINEVNRGRYQVLKENVAKWGMPNVYTTNYDPSKLSLDRYFDCVIVDAPCSGEGLFRKTPEAIDAWSTSNVTHCSKRQRRILNEAARMVRPGGYILYSTCTYNHEENILNCRYLVDNHHFASIKLNLVFNTIEQINGGSYGYQCYPHLVKGEGFYLSALKKNDEATIKRYGKNKMKTGRWVKASKNATALWNPYLRQSENLAIFISDANTYFAIPHVVLEDYLFAMHKLPHGSPSLILGQIKGTDIVPHHSLALSNIVSEDHPRIELTLEQAISYLRKDTITGVKGGAAGWHLASYNGHLLGWLKQTSRHLKNYFPTHLRIRKRR